jgi:hypothetical protein
MRRVWCNPKSFLIFRLPVRSPSPFYALRAVAVPMTKESSKSRPDQYLPIASFT